MVNKGTDGKVCSSTICSKCYFRLQNLKQRPYSSGCTRKYHGWKKTLKGTKTKQRAQQVECYQRQFRPSVLKLTESRMEECFAVNTTVYVCEATAMERSEKVYYFYMTTEGPMGVAGRKL